jgi:hypothetical protein
MTTEFGGITVPSFRKAPPATIDPAPMTHPSMMVAPIPIRQSSPISQPCRVTWWVIEQLAPTMVGVPAPTWIITKSCMLARRPMTTRWLSARTTTLHQIEASSPISARPNSRADGSIQAEPQVADVWAEEWGGHGELRTGQAPWSEISDASHKRRSCQSDANRA